MYHNLHNFYQNLDFYCWNIISNNHLYQNLNNLYHNLKNLYHNLKSFYHNLHNFDQNMDFVLLRLDSFQTNILEFLVEILKKSTFSNFLRSRFAS